MTGDKTWLYLYYISNRQLSQVRVAYISSRQLSQVRVAYISSRQLSQVRVAYISSRQLSQVRVAYISNRQLSQVRVASGKRPVVLQPDFQSQKSTVFHCLQHTGFSHGGLPQKSTVFHCVQHTGFSHGWLPQKSTVFHCFQHAGFSHAWLPQKSTVFHCFQHTGFSHAWLPQKSTLNPTYNVKPRYWDHPKRARHAGSAHPSYSPRLARWDSGLFPLIKRVLAGSVGLGVVPPHPTSVGWLDMSAVRTSQSSKLRAPCIVCPTIKTPLTLGMDNWSCVYKGEESILMECECCR